MPSELGQRNPHYSKHLASDLRAPNQSKRINASPPERSSGASLRQAPEVHILLGAPSIMPVERATSSARSAQRRRTVTPS